MEKAELGNLSRDSSFCKNNTVPRTWRPVAQRDPTELQPDGWLQGESYLSLKPLGFYTKTCCTMEIQLQDLDWGPLLV